MATRKSKRKSGGSKFSWNPETFAAAKQFVDLAKSGTPQGAVFAQVLVQAIRVMGGINGLGGLSCPAPTGDPTGVYRVGLDGSGRPEIQRDDGLGHWGAP